MFGCSCCWFLPTDGNVIMMVLLIFFFLFQQFSRSKITRNEFSEAKKELEGLHRHQSSCTTIFKSPNTKKGRKKRWRWDMTSVHFPSHYPIWPLWDPIAWEPRIPFSSEQEVLLFAAVTIRHRDRKQILIIIWTHHTKKKEKENHQ